MASIDVVSKVVNDLLMLAIKDDRPTEITTILTRNPKLVTTPDASGKLLIHRAVIASASISVIDAILKSMEMPSHLLLIDANGCTPLWYAFEYSRFELQTHLVKLAPTALLISPPSEKSLLRQIIRRPDGVRGLQSLELALGQDWIRNSSSTVADLVGFATKSGQESTVCYLINCYPTEWMKLDRKGRRPLHLILRKISLSNAPTLRKLLYLFSTNDWFFSMITDGDPPIIMNAYRGNLVYVLEWYALFLNRPEWVDRVRSTLLWDQRPRNLLHRAVAKFRSLRMAISIITTVGGGGELLRTFLLAPDTKGRLPWYVAAINGNRESLELLIFLGTNNLQLPRELKPYPAPNRILISDFRSQNRPILMALLPGLVDDSGPIKKIQAIRERIYFEPSLTSRLLYFV